MDAASHRSNLFSLVARSFHVGQHFGHSQERAQINRSGLMTRQNLGHTLVDLDFKTIDFFLVLSNAIYETHFTGGERLHSVLHHGLNKPTHLQ